MKLKLNLNKLSNIISNFEDEKRDNKLKELVDKDLKKKQNVSNREEKTINKLLFNLYEKELNSSSIDGVESNQAIFIHFGLNKKALKTQNRNYWIEDNKSEKSSNIEIKRALKRVLRSFK